MQLHRLTTREQFQAVLASTPIAKTEHFVMHRMDIGCADGSTSASADRLFPDHAGAWLGGLVPKRWARRSVTRHLIKRQIYAAGVAVGDLLHPANAYLVRMRKDYPRQRFPSAASDVLRQAVHQEIRQLFDKATRTRGISP